VNNNFEKKEEKKRKEKKKEEVFGKVIFLRSFAGCDFPLAGHSTLAPSFHFLSFFLSSKSHTYRFIHSFQILLLPIKQIQLLLLLDLFIHTYYIHIHTTNKQQAAATVGSTSLVLPNNTQSITRPGCKLTQVDLI
jgi:hypothetical protein